MKAEHPLSERLRRVSNWRPTDPVVFAVGSRVGQRGVVLEVRRGGGSLDGLQVVLVRLETGDAIVVVGGELDSALLGEALGG